MRRWLGLLGPVGSLVFVAATIAAAHEAHANPVTDGYLSELGASGAAGAGTFHLGLVAAAIGCLGVAAALSTRLPLRDPRVLALAASALTLLGQTIARCTTACPLPVADGWVPAADLVHFAIAAAGFVLWTAVTSIDATALDALTRRGSRAATTVLLGHLTVLGGLVLIDPHGTAAVVLQRTLVLTALAWVSVAGVLATGPRRGPG